MIVKDVSERIEQIKRGITDEGVTYKAIAEKMRVHPSTVAYWMNVSRQPFQIDRVEEAFAEIIEDKLTCRDAEEREREKRRKAIEVLRIAREAAKGKKRDACLRCVWSKYAGGGIYTCPFARCVMKKKGVAKSELEIKYFSM